MAWGSHLALLLALGTLIAMVYCLLRACCCCCCCCWLLGRGGLDVELQGFHARLRRRQTAGEGFFYCVVFLFLEGLLAYLDDMVGCLGAIDTIQYGRKVGLPDFPTNAFRHGGFKVDSSGALCDHFANGSFNTSCLGIDYNMWKPHLVTNPAL